LIEVERGDIVEKALAIGRIEPEKEIAVKSKISGIVRKVFVEVGDLVNPGQALMEIKPDPTPLEFAEAKRNSEIALNNFERASNEYDRMKKLLESRLISQKDFEIAENDYKQSKLRLNMAQERLALIDLGSTKVADRQVDTIIKSSVAGTVLERRVNEGDPVVPLTSYQAGTELLLLADMESLIFKGTVDEIDVGKLEEGMEAELKIGAIPDETIWGMLNRISPKAKKQDNATLFDVEITITKKGNKVIRAGYSANAELLINKAADTLFIPERLVIFEEDRTYVEVQNEVGGIDKKEVKTGLSDGINVEILEGLAQGEEVVENPPKEIK
jgi:HlyD family secretion protein